jgi:hypothetical protein
MAKGKRREKAEREKQERTQTDLKAHNGWSKFQRKEMARRLQHERL